MKTEDEIRARLADVRLALTALGGPGPSDDYFVAVGSVHALSWALGDERSASEVLSEIFPPTRATEEVKQ